MRKEVHNVPLRRFLELANCLRLSSYLGYNMLQLLVFGIAWNAHGDLVSGIVPADSWRGCDVAIFRRTFGRQNIQSTWKTPLQKADVQLSFDPQQPQNPFLVSLHLVFHHVSHIESCHLKWAPIQTAGYLRSLQPTVQPDLLDSHGISEIAWCRLIPAPGPGRPLGDESRKGFWDGFTSESGDLYIVVTYIWMGTLNHIYCIYIYIYIDYNI